jgi:hypothetical protein
MTASQYMSSNLYYLGGPLLMILGTISCICNIFVFIQKTLRKNPCSICLIAFNVTIVLRDSTCLYFRQYFKSAIISNLSGIDPIPEELERYAAVKTFGNQEMLRDIFLRSIISGHAEMSFALLLQLRFRINRFI